MPSIAFEGRRIAVAESDTVASALYRAGVRTFTRSIKHHRRRGLYCLTGDCGSCLVNVNGDPGVRSCTTEARDGMRVRREAGWPSAERDLLAIADRLHPLMPVGFYSKVFIRPRSAWRVAERLIAHTTGIGRLPERGVGRPKDHRSTHTDVLVVGAGIAGLSAAEAAAARGERVLVVDEARVGERLPPGSDRERVAGLARTLRERSDVQVLERHVAIGAYEGPLVPVVGETEILRVNPRRVIVAAGGVETHAVFGGNDLPGIWLGRGAVRMVAAHRVRLGRRAVVVAGCEEGLEHIEALIGAGQHVAAAVLPHAADASDRVPLVLRDGTVVRAEGRSGVRAVVVEADGVRRRIECDALVVSLGTVPRDGLLRMADGLPVAGAGEILHPSCTMDEAAADGRRAGQGRSPRAGGAARPALGRPFGRDGYVCPCEDVSARDLSTAWREGWRSTEILKRYTTATMGVCRGALCARQLGAFVAHASSSEDGAAVLTTARPPSRPVALEDLAAGVHEAIEKRTSLHDHHVEEGARVDWSGSWKRAYHYGDPADEYLAVRQRVSLMDVGTLGKFLIAGRDATEFADRVFPVAARSLAPGRTRYVVALDEAGYVMDDGMLCALGADRYYLTSTSGGADRLEAWLRDWVERFDMHVHLVNQTSMLGAINLAGPHARDLLERLTDDAVGRTALPYMAHAEVRVAGVRTRAVRSGFVGELSFELHHPRSRGVGLWDALVRAGEDLGQRPHGLDALDALRLEKGHFYIGQDTLPDDHPDKLGLGWILDRDEGAFVGAVAARRMREVPLERKLVGLTFDTRPQRGAPLSVDSRIVGRITSCAWSAALDRHVGLGWIRAVDGSFPRTLRSGDVTATVVPRPFYDPEGARLRA